MSTPVGANDGALIVRLIFQHFLILASFSRYRVRTGACNRACSLPPSCVTSQR
jgi:hypothetical protein